MLNILSYVGMNMQSELYLWTLLGLLRTIFDATLFKVNANLKQVWQMSMPAELSMPVQSVIRTMISGIMLVQCFTVYVYLASYIVLLYPVFLEERPVLVLPWLLLAAVRKLLCELTSLAVGLGTCVLLGTAKPPCIKFVIFKITSIMPAFYIWMLVYSYYHVLKVASAFKTFPVMLPPDEPDDGLELAVRRRRTKSLFTEEHLRKKLVAGFYAGTSSPCNTSISQRQPMNPTVSPVDAKYSESSMDDAPVERDILQPLSVASTRNTIVGVYDDWFGREVIIPRGDRILEQFITMLLRIGIHLNRDEAESIKSHMFNSNIATLWAPCENIEAVSSDGSDTPPQVANSKGQTASYLREYPQIFMKRLSSDAPQPDISVFPLPNTESTVINRLRSNSCETSISPMEKNESVRTLSKRDKKSGRSDTSYGFEILKPGQITMDTDEWLNIFVREILDNCILNVSDRLKVLNLEEEEEQQSTAITVGSDEIVLSEPDDLKYENISKICNENEKIVALALLSSKSEHHEEGIVLETQNTENAFDDLKGKYCLCYMEREDNSVFSLKKPKMD